MAALISHTSNSPFDMAPFDKLRIYDRASLGGSLCLLFSFAPLAHLRFRGDCPGAYTLKS